MEMERKLRIQLTVSVAVALTLMLGFVILLTAAVRSQQMNATADGVLEVVLDYEGSVPQGLRKLPNTGPATVEDVFDAQYFVVHIDSSGQVTDSNLNGIATLEEDEATDLARAVYQRWDTGGRKRVGTSMPSATA